MSGDPEIFRLVAGNAVAELAPSLGGRLMRWTLKERPILYWPEKVDWSKALHVRGGNPLLFPFIARTFLHGKIGFWLGPDKQVRPAPRHGLVRGAAFETEVLAANRIRMTLTSSLPMLEAYPFAFVFRVEYVLGETEIEVAYTVENHSLVAMPFSLGNHFYFAVPAQERDSWSLDCPSHGWARQGKDGKIVPEERPASALLSNPSLVDLFHLGPPSQGVVLRHQQDGRRLIFDLGDAAEGGNPWFALTTWTEAPESPFYCLEPWTALPDAVHNQQGLRWLKSGDQETLRLRLRAEGW